MMDSGRAPVTTEQVGAGNAIPLGPPSVPSNPRPTITVADIDLKPKVQGQGYSHTDASAEP